MKEITLQMTAMWKKLCSCWKDAVAENGLEGIRLNLFGGTMRENIAYLKSQNKKA